MLRIKEIKVKRVTNVALLAGVLVLSACGSRGEDDAQADSPPAVEAGNPPGDLDSAPRRVTEEHCRGNLLSSLALGHKLVRVSETSAGCELVADVEATFADAESALTRTLLSQGYQLEEAVPAKGGVRLSFTSPDGLAISALVRKLRAAEGVEAAAVVTRVDLHWYDPKLHSR